MLNSETTRLLIGQSLDQVEQWVERHNYCGYEPFDGLSSWFRPLAFGSLLGERLLLQCVRQCPLNLRPLMGVTPKDSTKGRGYMASGYVIRYRSTGNPQYLQKAGSCLDWLAKHTGNREYIEVARSAMEYSCSRQRADGSWWYAEVPKYHWIDNFHTGYNLDSLRSYIEYTGDETWRSNLIKGLAFYKAHFFEE